MKYSDSNNTQISSKLQCLATEKEPPAKYLQFLNTREQMLVADEYIRIRELLRDFGTPHVIRSMMVSRVC